MFAPPLVWYIAFMRSRLFAALCMMLLVPTASASPPAPRNVQDFIPCGTRANPHLSFYNWPPSPPWQSFRATFDASGGGTVWFNAVPVYGSVNVPPDNVTRPYEITVTVAMTSPVQNPIPLQVVGIADEQPCKAGLTITNISVGPATATKP